MNRDILRRLDRLEGDRHEGAPTRILADRWMENEEGAVCLANWRELVAAGEATVLGAVLCITTSEILTEDEWIARHVTAH